MPKSTQYLLHILIPTIISLFVFMFSGEIVNGQYSVGNDMIGEGPFYITGLSYSLSFLIFALNYFMQKEVALEQSEEL